MKKIDTLKTFLISIIVLFFSFSLIFCGNKYSNGIKAGLTFCSELLIPSLFPFMVLSSFVVKSSLTSKISKILSPVTRIFFNLPGCTAMTILIGLIGGYPTGARGIKSLLDRKEISKTQAKRMILFTVGSGPAFAISIVGIKLLKSYQAGIILFVSQILSSLFLGILLRFNKEKYEEKKIKIYKNLNLADALVSSCEDATIAMLNMCSFVILFCSALAFLKNTFMENIIAFFLKNIRIDSRICESFFSIIFEVTSACEQCYFSKVSYPFFAFLLAWAGTCVHFQIYSIMGNIKFSKSKFIFFRLLQGLIAWGISHILFYFFPVAQGVLLIKNKNLNFNTHSFTSGSIALILLCACFLCTLTPKIIEPKNKGEKCEKVIWKKH